MFGWLFGRKADEVETRSSGTGYTAQIMGAREAYIAGRSGIAELTATAQTCVSLYEAGLAMADVEGTDLLDRASLALVGRSLALRGEAVFLIGDRLIPVSDWDLSTRDGKPRAYRLSIPEVGGGRSRTALAAEVLHVRIGADVAAPWYGQAPLRRASLTAGTLNAVETALGEVFENAPIGSMVLPFPETPETDLEEIGRGFRGRRGRVMLRESVQVQAAGGPAPAQDWRPSHVTPDLQKAMTTETLEASRNAIAAAFGVLPALLNASTTGPLVREAQRHLAQWQLQPMAALLAEEATAKLGTPVSVDVMRPTQAYDQGARSRALTAIVQAMSQAKEAGLEPAQLQQAFGLVDWKE
ncbi:phage portal protein [Halovulum sp. GXIMD14794]